MHQEYRTKFGGKRSISAFKNKWESVVKRYRDVTDNNNMSGAVRQECDFMSELDEIFYDNPSVHPEFTSADLKKADKKRKRRTLKD